MKASEMLTSAILKMEQNLMRGQERGKELQEHPPSGVVNIAEETILEN